jgi:uncharacterized membrane protein YdbT with pleckstrin-like domain
MEQTSNPQAGTPEHISFDHQKETSDLSERDFPIQPFWAFRNVPGTLISLTIYFFFISFEDSDAFEFSWRKLIVVLFFAICIALFLSIRDLLKMHFFHYAFSGQGIVLKQGIIRKQQRIVPYHVVQNVWVKRKIYDRIFGWSTIIIENAVGAGGSPFAASNEAMVKDVMKKRSEQSGFSGNTVVIPGLKKASAEKLKNYLLSRVKDSAPERDLGI